MYNKKNILQGVIIDILILSGIVALSIFVRFPSLEMPSISNEYQSCYRMDNGSPYLYDMDSYYYVRQVERYINKDNHSETIIEGINDDELLTTINSSNDSLASRGFSFIVFLCWTLYNHFFNISIYDFVVYFGPLFASLAAIPSYFFVKKRTNRIGGITAGIATGISTAFVAHTGFACFDTDIITCILPLIFICCLIELLESGTTKQQILWGCISSSAFLVLIVSWSTYGIYYFLSLGILVITLIHFFISKKKISTKYTKRDAFHSFTYSNDDESIPIFHTLSFKSEEYNNTINESILTVKKLKGSLIIGFLFFILNTLLCLVIRNSIDLTVFNSFFNLVKGSGSFSSDQYPDAGKFVSELSDVPLFSGGITRILSTDQPGILNRMGGIIILIVCLTTIIILIVEYIKKFKVDLTPTTGSHNKKPFFNKSISTISIIFWFLCSLITLVGGYRFVQIVSIPLALIIGIGSGIGFSLLAKKHLKLFAIFCMIGILFPLVWGGYILSQKQVSSANDSLYNASKWINNTTEKDAVILSWWDNGYFYQYEGNRRTLGDGGTFNGRYYYWLSNALLTDDENLMAGIARMLQNSGTDASIIIDEITEDSKRGCELLKEILVQGKTSANDTLQKEGFSEEDIARILPLTHPDYTPEIYIIIEGSLFSKIPALNYYANWTFDDENIISEDLSEDSLLYKLFTTPEYKSNILKYEFCDTIKTDDYSISSTVIWKLNANTQE